MDLHPDVSWGEKNMKKHYGLLSRPTNRMSWVLRLWVSGQGIEFRSTAISHVPLSKPKDHLWIWSCWNLRIDWFATVFVDHHSSLSKIGNFLKGWHLEQWFMSWEMSQFFPPPNDVIFLGPSNRSVISAASRSNSSPCPTWWVFAWCHGQFFLCWQTPKVLLVLFVAILGQQILGYFCRKPQEPELGILLHPCQLHKHHTRCHEILLQKRGQKSSCCFEYKNPKYTGNTWSVALWALTNILTMADVINKPSDATFWYILGMSMEKISFWIWEIPPLNATGLNAVLELLHLLFQAAWHWSPCCPCWPPKFRISSIENLNFHRSGLSPNKDWWLKKRWHARIWKVRIRFNQQPPFFHPICWFQKGNRKMPGASLGSYRICPGTVGIQGGQLTLENWIWDFKRWVNQAVNYWKKHAG